MEPGDSDIIASGYDAFYSVWGRSPTLRRIWRQHVAGPDFPEEFAHISFLSVAQLRSLTEGLHLAGDQLLVDLACGAGGPGLFAAKESGARLVGVDLSAVAAERAAERAVAVGMGTRATFRQGNFEATGLSPKSADAVMTVDALQYAPDKRLALAEVARVDPAARPIRVVAFELDAERIAGHPVWQDPVSDYRPLLKQAGFDVLYYEQIPDWQQHVVGGFGAILEEQDALGRELGEAAAAAIILEAAITLELRPYCGHVLAITVR